MELRHECSPRKPWLLHVFGNVRPVTNSGRIVLLDPSQHNENASAGA